MGLQDAKFMGIIMLTVLLVFGLFSALVPEANITIVSDDNQFKQWFNAETGFFDVTIDGTNVTGTGGLSDSDNANAMKKLTDTNITQDDDRSDDFSFFSIGVIWDFIKAVGSLANAPYEVVSDLVNLDESTSFLFWLPILIGAIWFFMWLITIAQIFSGRS